MSLDDIVASMVSHLVLPRMGMPDEVAAAVAFLASDDAAFVSGMGKACLHVLARHVCVGLVTVQARSCRWMAGI